MKFEERAAMAMDDNESEDKPARKRRDGERYYLSLCSYRCILLKMVNFVTSYEVWGLLISLSVSTTLTVEVFGKGSFYCRGCQILMKLHTKYYTYHCLEATFCKQI